MPKYLVEMHDGRKFQVEADTPPSEEEVMAHLGGGAPAKPYVADSPLAHHLNEQEGAGDWGQRLADAGQSLAHPQSATDIGGLLISNGGAAVVGRVLKPVGDAISRYGGAAAKLAAAGASAVLPKAAFSAAKAGIGVLSELNPSEWNSPLTVAGREGRAAAAARAFNDLPLAEQMRQLPTTSAAQGTLRTGTPMRAPGNEVPPVVPPAPAGPHMDLSQPMRPGEMSQQQILERMRAVRDAGGTSIPPAAAQAPIGGRLQMAPTERPPITVAPAESPLAGNGTIRTSPRIIEGADALARKTGQTPTAVRLADGPVGAEQPGAAREAVSNNRLDNDIGRVGPRPDGRKAGLLDRMFSLAPGEERATWSNAGTSEKIRTQTLAMTRTADYLRQVRDSMTPEQWLDWTKKLAVTGGVSSEAIRQAVMSRLRGSSREQ